MAGDAIITVSPDYTNKALADPNVGDSIADVLLDQIVPRLPLSDTIATDADTAVTDGKVDAVKAETALIVEDTGTTIPALIATVQADLDNPSQYKSDATLAKQNAIETDTQDIQSTLATPATFKSDATLAKQNAIIADTEDIQSTLVTKGEAFVLVFPIYTTSNTLISGATALDSEISKDGGSFTDCTNEATEIDSTGLYTLSLTTTEMTANYIVIRIKTTSANAVTSLIIIYTIT